MMTSARNRMMGLIAISAVFSFAVSVAQGCGSDSFTAAPSTDGGFAEGGDDSAIAADGGTDSGPGCLLVPPNVPESDIEFCKAFAEVYDRCGSCESCRQEDVSNCGAIGDSFSDSFKAALVACKDSLGCDDLQSQTLGKADCLTQQAQLATPTTEQNGVKQAYCDNCPDDGGAGFGCSNFFFLADGGPTAATAVLDMNEAVATTVATKCGKSCGALAFGICEEIYYCGTAPKTQCTQGLCK